MGWREPEAQDAGKVVFSRAFKRTEGNLIRAKEILRNSYLSRHGAEMNNAEAANIYFDQAMKTKPNEAWDALLKEILKGDSKRIWHGELMENLTEEERKLVLPMMKNYIERSTDPLATLRRPRLESWCEETYKTSSERHKVRFAVWNRSLSLFP